MHFVDSCGVRKRRRFARRDGPGLSADGRAQRSSSSGTYHQVPIYPQGFMWKNAKKDVLGEASQSPPQKFSDT